MEGDRVAYVKSLATIISGAHIAIFQVTFCSNKVHNLSGEVWSSEISQQHHKFEAECFTHTAFRQSDFDHINSLVQKIVAHLIRCDTPSNQMDLM